MLHHDTAPMAILSTASEEGPTIRRFTRDNPVIQDDINVSPPRDYDEMDSWLFAPINGTVSPISSHSSSIGYFSGSDWTTDSSWFTYDSLVQSVFQQPISSPFRPISPLPPVPDVPQESRGPRGVTGHIQREERLKKRVRKSIRTDQNYHKQI